MKRNFIKKITAILISLILAFSTTTVFASTDIDFSKYIDYDANYTKNDIENLGLQIEPGSRYTEESLERHWAAYGYAMDVLNDPNATQEEINKAYIEYYEAILSLEYCFLDMGLAISCFEYCVYLDNNYIDCFTEESRQILGDCIFDLQMAVLFENSQYRLDQTTQEAIEKLRAIELATENSDIVFWDELIKTDEFMQEYISKNTFDDVDYAYNKIPVFKDFNGYRMVLFYNMLVGPMFNVQRYGDYIIEMNGYYHPSSLCYVLVNPTTGDIKSLDEGILNGIVDTDKLFEAYLNSPFAFDMHIIGDADCDNQLTIKDATYIQKICAYLEDDTNTYQASNFNDFNNDRKVNIIDATEIQKALVN